MPILQSSTLASQLSPSHPFTQAIHEIQSELLNHPEFRKTSIAKRRSFAVDISLIAFSIRTAYLVDVIAPNEPVKVFSQLIHNLRQKNHTSLFSGVVHLHEPCSNQSFFVNNLLIHRLLDPGHVVKGQGGPSFVNLEDPPTLLTDPPPDLLVLLRSIPFPFPTAHTSVVIPSTPPPTQRSTVPFAALLLEYPIAYVPISPDQTLFLSRVPLDVYEVVLIFVDSRAKSDRNKHTLLKFSCPCVLDPLGTLAEKLRERFQARLQEASLDHDILLCVHHHSETFDRVAL